MTHLNIVLNYAKRRGSKGPKNGSIKRKGSRKQ